MQNIKKPLGKIDLHNIHDDELLLLDIKFEMFEDKVVKLFKKNKHFTFWCDFYDIFAKRRVQTQEEFPLMALPWFIDTIENCYWSYQQTQSEAPGDISESIVIDGELIGVTPARNCCAENLPGYSFWNKSRLSYLSKRPPQSRGFPKHMLKDGLLDEFKRISTELGLKAY